MKSGAYVGSVELSKNKYEWYLGSFSWDPYRPVHIWYGYNTKTVRKLFLATQGYSQAKQRKRDTYFSTWMNRLERSPDYVLHKMWAILPECNTLYAFCTECSFNSYWPWIKITSVRKCLTSNCTLGVVLIFIHSCVFLFLIFKILIINIQKMINWT